MIGPYGEINRVAGSSAEQIAKEQAKEVGGFVARHYQGAYKVKGIGNALLVMPADGVFPEDADIVADYRSRQ